MSVSAQKAKAPITSVIVSPINESVTFSADNTIIFRIGPSDLLYWLVQDSYFMFDVEWSKTDNATLNNMMVIRGSGMFFDNVQILHAGNQVYYSQYNIAQQMLDMVKSGSDYLDSNFCEWTTHRTLEKLYNNKFTTTSPLVFGPTDFIDDAGAVSTRTTKRGVIVRVGQILKCFSQCTNFPLKYLTQQLEIRLQLAKVENFVCLVSNDRTGISSGGNAAARNTRINNYINGPNAVYGNQGEGTDVGAFYHNNFYDWNGNTTVPGVATDPLLTANSGARASNEPAASGHNLGLTYTIKNMRLYMFGEDVDPGYDMVMSAENAGGQGKIWKYQMPRINLRNETVKAVNYYISNFQCITENTDKLFLWAVRGTNLSCMIKPHVKNMNLRFGPYQIPKSPTQEENWTKPAIYKALVDDTLEYSTAYYTSANDDLMRCYSIKRRDPDAIDRGNGAVADTADTASNLNTNSASATYTPPHDTYIMLAGSFTTDDGKPGSNSKAWNSQYNLHYNIETEEQPFTWVLLVDTDYVLTLRNGMLSSTNI